MRADAKAYRSVGLDHVSPADPSSVRATHSSRECMRRIRPLLVNFRPPHAQVAAADAQQQIAIGRKPYVVCAGNVETQLGHIGVRREAQVVFDSLIISVKHYVQAACCALCLGARKVGYARVPCAWIIAEKVVTLAAQSFFAMPAKIRNPGHAKRHRVHRSIGSNER